MYIKIVFLAVQANQVVIEFFANFLRAIYGAAWKSLKIKSLKT